MNKTLEQIVELLPEGLTETGIEEISQLVESAIEQRVDEEVSTLSTKVSGYLRFKIDEMKELAVKELEAEHETFRALKVYEALKTAIAEDISTKDESSAISQYRKENEELRESLNALSERHDAAVNENQMLEGAVESLREDVASVMETEKAPFKSSEQALVINNENLVENRLPEDSELNSFLTEDVLNLANNLL